jgi:hypothetical protein
MNFGFGSFGSVPVLTELTEFTQHTGLSNQEKKEKERKKRGCGCARPPAPPLAAEGPRRHHAIPWESGRC